MGREDEIRLIAYDIWEVENCPDGCDCEHWYRAEVIWEQRQKPQAAVKNTKKQSKKTVEQKEKVKIAKKK